VVNFYGHFPKYSWFKKFIGFYIAKKLFDN